MRELLDFLLAVLSHWVSLMSGLVSVIIGLWLRVRGGKDIRSDVFLLVALLCIFFACFLAWRGEHRSSLALMESELPKLSGSIDQVAILRLPEGPTGIMMWVTVRNSGAPSIADNYRLEYHALSGLRIPLTLEAAPPAVIFDGKKIDTGKEAIYDKTAEQPIPRGGTRRGMAFSRTDLPLATFHDATKFVLTFRDISGKMISITSVGMARNDNGMPKHVPGTSDAK
jgi:hypothetical protein